MRFASVLAIVSASLAGAGCSVDRVGGDDGNVSADAMSADLGVTRDAGALDEGAPDASPPDTGPPDAGTCGDGVVQPGEDCDPGDPSMLGCDAQCRRQCLFNPPCGTGWVCTQPSDGWGHCETFDPSGLAEGTPCTRNEECSTRWCDPDQARCSHLCGVVVGAGCEGGLECSTRIGADFDTHVGSRTSVCVAACAHDADCPASSACALVIDYPDGSPTFRGRCEPRISGGALGDTCDATMHRCAARSCVDSICTTTCVTDADCAPPLPHCVLRDLSGVVWSLPDGSVAPTMLCSP